jgi:hypothetical protein
MVKVLGDVWIQASKANFILRAVHLGLAVFTLIEDLREG